MLPELENPWILQSSETIVRNPWFHLRRDQVHHRLSGPGQYWVIEARPALGVVAVDDGGRIVLVGQFRYPLGHSSWELPEGGGEPGEELLETAMRELKEETGLIATRWTRLGHVHTSNCFSDETGTIFLAEGLQTGDAAPDPTEVLQLKTIALKDAMHCVRQGLITDAITVAGLYFYRDYLAGELSADALSAEEVQKCHSRLNL